MDNSPDKPKKAQPSSVPDSEKTVFRKPTRAAIPTEPVASTSAADDLTRIATSSMRSKDATQPQDDVTRFRAPSIAPTPSAPLTIEDALNPVSNAKPAPLKRLKNRFVLESILGVGGMGVVYKAKDLLKVEAQDRDPYVAIKVLNDEFKSHPEAFISLQREARKAQHIANQNTVKVYDFDRDGDTVFMTMEFMVGQPLDQMLKQYHATGLPRNDAWAILSGMCLALIHAHRENIVHSDLKPGNVFITENGIAKIFDFGIARAVANIDRSSGETQDRTVFDAGNLGALTPAYASREMLLGETPDTRDDIYALGCIAYEMFTGDHPFSRLPADEAYTKRLTPKRIIGISKKQWKVIESALEFKRDNRVVSVEQFYQQINAKAKSPIKLIVGFLLALGIAGVAYQQYSAPKTPQFSQSEFRNEIEFKIRYDYLKENINRLLISATFSPEWESDLYRDIQSSAALFESEPDQWYFDAKKRIYQRYLEKITNVISAKQFTFAQGLITNAAHYSDDSTALDKQQLALNNVIKIEQDRAQTLALEKQQQQERREQQRIATQQSQQLAAQRAKAKKIKNDSVNKTKNTLNLYNLAHNNVQKQLECANDANALSQLNMRDLKIAIDKLRALNVSRYRKSEPTFVSDLAMCINAVAKTNPPHATDLKRSALRIFKGSAILNAISIKAIDRCNASIAGLGARGSRALCRDKLDSGDFGPSMVVIPANSRLKSFAIGKYEVSIAQMSSYCRASGQCNAPVGQHTSLPMTGVSAAVIQRYAKWLSKGSHKKYRLPSVAEWTYAAKSARYRLDSNRNCQMSSRGISKGKELIKVTIGKQNSWGLVNYAGNAQELALGKGRKLVALGGSFGTPMESCTELSTVSHNGKADQRTGFRLVREIVSN